MSKSDEGHVLLNRDDKPRRGDNLSTAAGKWMTKHNLFGEEGRQLNIHGPRKLACMNLAEAGCSAHEMMATTGHQTIAMVDHYTTAIERRKLAESAMKKFPGSFSQ